MVVDQAPHDWLANTHRMAPALRNDRQSWRQPLTWKPWFLPGKKRGSADHLPPPLLVYHSPTVRHQGGAAQGRGWVGYPSPPRMTTPGNLTMTIVRQGLTTLLHVIGALALLASLDPTLTRLHAENYPLKPFNPVFQGCPPPNTSPKACRGGNKWITSGTDEGSCGLCGIKVFEFIPGTCSGETMGGGDTPICRECNVQPGSAQDRYQQVAAPLSEALVCMIGVLGASGSLWVVFCAGSLVLLR
jgi:hypothetical protein